MNEFRLLRTVVFFYIFVLEYCSVFAQHLPMNPEIHFEWEDSFLKNTHPDKSECYSVKFNIALYQDTIYFTTDNIYYSLDYYAPLSADEQRTINAILRGDSIAVHLAFEKLQSPIRKIVNKDLSSCQMDRLINYIISICPFLPKINSKENIPLPQKNSCFSISSHVKWEHLSIREYPISVVKYDIWADGYGAFFSTQLMSDKLRYFRDDTRQRTYRLTDRELSEINKLISHCNPTGFLNYYEKSFSDNNWFVFKINGHEFFRSYGLRHSIEDSYIDLEGYGNRFR